MAKLDTIPMGPAGFRVGCPSVAKLAALCAGGDSRSVLSSRFLAPHQWSGAAPRLQMNAGSMFPITATQFGCNRLLEQTYERVLGVKPGLGGSIVVAMAAGGASALLGCPTEFIVIHQQKTGQSIPAVASQIVRAYGPLKLFKGLVSRGWRGTLGSCVPVWAGQLLVLPVLLCFGTSNSNQVPAPAGVHHSWLHVSLPAAEIAGLVEPHSPLGSSLPCWPL